MSDAALEFRLHADSNFHYEVLRSLGATPFLGSDIQEQLARAAPWSPRISKFGSGLNGLSFAWVAEACSKTCRDWFEDVRESLLAFVKLVVAF